MANMDGWSWALWAAAAYLAGAYLIRLMKLRYDHLLGQLRHAWREEQERLAEEERRTRREERQRRLREQMQTSFDESSDRAA